MKCNAFIFFYFFFLFISLNHSSISMPIITQRVTTTSLQSAKQIKVSGDQKKNNNNRISSAIRWCGDARPLEQIFFRMVVRAKREWLRTWTHYTVWPLRYMTSSDYHYGFHSSETWINKKHTISVICGIAVVMNRKVFTNTTHEALFTSLNTTFTLLDWVIPHNVRGICYCFEFNRTIRFRSISVF